jgi:ABC-type Na+ efflux pump permease subunit
MNQFCAILKKESRQQGQLAAAMLLLCFLIQLGAFMMTLFPGTIGRVEPAFFGIALLMTALFSGAAAAISFSSEHDEKTFGFLRSLPVSPLTVLAGKTAWLVLGTIFVAVLSSLFALFWNFITGNHFNTVTLEHVLGSVGVGILEAFAWGLFWSPRCRSQIHALLATYFCASISGYTATLFSATSTSVLESYCNAVPVRFGIAAIVTVFAVRGALKWFDMATQKRSRFFETEKEKRGWFRYPKTPQSPFFALLHQSIRQSQTILLCGLAVSIYADCIILFKNFNELNQRGIVETDFFIFLSILGCVVFYIVFCGSIFAQDQKNNSFRFLSRCGISARKIWWSRIQPFLIIYFLIFIAAIIKFYLPVLVLSAAKFIFGTESVVTQDPHFVLFQYLHSNYVIIVGSIILSVWLIPFSVGAFLSIYCRSMIVSVSLTGAVSVLLFGWMIIVYILCAFNPLWAVLPIAVALLVASRLRAADWLREQRTWKSRLKPLIPFFVTLVVIIVAMPLVRIYSVPYVSLEEVEALLDKTHLAERLSPTKRKALFRETAARLSQKLTENDIDQIEYWNDICFHHRFRFLVYQEKIQIQISKLQLEKMKNDCKFSEERIKLIPPFETYILHDYEIKTRIINAGLKHVNLPHTDGSQEKNIIKRCRYLPWEKMRILRRFNWRLHQQIYASCTSWTVDPYQKAYDHNFETQMRIEKSNAALDFLPREWDINRLDYFSVVNTLRLKLVHSALYLWYLEHDGMLPESLDELVGTYLDEIPCDPQTGAAMKYYPKQDGEESHTYLTNFPPQTKLVSFETR